LINISNEELVYFEKKESVNIGGTFYNIKDKMKDWRKNIKLKVALQGFSGLGRRVQKFLSTYFSKSDFCDINEITISIINSSCNGIYLFSNNINTFDILFSIFFRIDCTKETIVTKFLNSNYNNNNYREITIRDLEKVGLIYLNGKKAETPFNVLKYFLLQKVNLKLEILNENSIWKNYQIFLTEYECIRYEILTKVNNVKQYLKMEDLYEGFKFYHENKLEFNKEIFFNRCIHYVKNIEKKFDYETLKNLKFKNSTKTSFLEYLMNFLLLNTNINVVINKQGANFGNVFIIFNNNILNSNYKINNNNINNNNKIIIFSIQCIYSVGNEKEQTLKLFEIKKELVNSFNVKFFFESEGLNCEIFTIFATPKNQNKDIDDTNDITFKNKYNLPMFEINKLNSIPQPTELQFNEFVFQENNKRIKEKFEDEFVYLPFAILSRENTSLFFGKYLTCLTPFLATEFFFINDSPPEVLCQYPGISWKIANDIIERRQNKCFTKKEIEEFVQNNNKDLDMMNSLKKLNLELQIFE
jgi:hypothetical protein